MAIGRDGVGPQDGVIVPAPLRMTGNTFSPHPCPLGSHEAQPHPVKLYFLLIFPTTSTIFLMKPISLIKNILEITTKFISSNQINFLEKIE